VVAKAARARQARWECENRMARRRQAAGAQPNLSAADPTVEWPIFLLFIGMFLAFVVIAVVLVVRLNL
jgi:hypothetical protein